MIPKNIYYTHESEDLINKQTLQYNKESNPGYTFHFYASIQRRNFIKEYFPEFLFFYDKINDGYGAVKADIFRVLILYKYGGIYMDHKTVMEDDSFLENKNYDIYLCFLPIFLNFENYFFLNNHFIATEKEGYIITMLKNKIYNNLKKLYQNKIMSSVTRGFFGVHSTSGPFIYDTIYYKNKDKIFRVKNNYVTYKKNVSEYEQFVKTFSRKNYHLNTLPILKR